MRLTIAYFKIKKRNLVLINNGTYQKETLSERPNRQPLKIEQNSVLRILLNCFNLCLKQLTSSSGAPSIDKFFEQPWGVQSVL